MRYVTDVKGSQKTMPEDFEVNGARVYARAGIQEYSEASDTGETIKGWTYEEVVLTAAEYDALKALNTDWVKVWSSALRCAERRARYERMDPKVSSLRRKIDLGIDVEENQARLLAIQEYCKAVTDTQESEGYPSKVTYPDEPSA